MAPGVSMASLSLYILTYNCGRALIDVQAFASQLFNAVHGSSLPGLLVISLQEVAPLAHSFIGGSVLAPYFARIHAAVNVAARKFSGSDGALYASVVTRNVGMTAIMVFAKDPTIIEGIETAGVGVGISETGNKGAVGVRLVYSSTEMTFVAAHLAHMESAVERRNEDWKNIVRGLVFTSTAQDRHDPGPATSLSGSTDEEERPLLTTNPRYAGIYKPTSHLFVAGDLNYRTGALKPGPDDYKEFFPQPHHGPTSPQHYSKLFQKDQLTQEMEAGRTCHGLIESQVNFPPTYKYTEEEPFLVPDEDLTKWSWATHRWPSWCDRILYLDTPAWLKRKDPTACIVAHEYIALPLFPTSDHRAVAQAFTVPLVPIPIPQDSEEDDTDPRIKPPFNINPDWKSQRDLARKEELLAGISAYLMGTWEGWTMIIATVAGIVGGYFMLKAIFDF